MADKQFSMSFLLGGKLASSFNSTFKAAQTRMTKLKDAGEQITNISTKMATGIGVVGGAVATAAGGMALFVTATNKAQSEMMAMSDAMGVSLDSTRMWGGLMESIGGNWENYTDLIEEMTNKMGELNATGKMKKFQEALGYSNLEFEKMQKMKPQKQFETIMDSLLKMKDGQKAAFIADEIFGGEGNKMIQTARLQGKSVAELYAQYNKYNLYTEEAQKKTKAFNDAMTPLNKLASSAKDQFAALLGGALTPMIKRMTEWSVANKDIINSKLSEWATSFANSLQWVITNFEKIVFWAKAIGVAVGVFTTLAAVIKAVTIATTIFNAVMAVNPIVLIIMAVALLAAGIYALIQRLGGFRAVWGMVVEKFKAGWQLIKSGGMSVINWFASLPSKFVEFGRNLLQGLANGIKSGVKAALNAAGEAVEAVKNKVKGVFGINSPSKVFAQYGAWNMEGLANGMTKSSPMAQTAAQTAIEPIMPQTSGQPLASSSRSPTNITVSINQNITGGQNVAEQAQAGVMDAVKQIQAHNSRKNRLSFA